MKKTPEEIKQDLDGLFEDSDNNFDLKNQLVQYIQESNESHHSDKLSEVAGELPSVEDKYPMTYWDGTIDLDIPSNEWRREAANWMRSIAASLLAKKQKEAEEDAVGFKDWCDAGSAYFFDNQEQHTHTTKELYAIYKSKTT